MIRPLHTILAFAAVLLPAAAAANIPTPSMFGYSAPFWAAWGTGGLSFLAIWLIEAIAFKFLVSLPWKTAFLYSIILNAATSLAGVALVSPATGLILFFVLLLAFSEVGRFGFSRRKSMMVYGFVAMLLLAWAILTFRHGLDPRAFWGALAPAFLATSIVECLGLIYLTRGRFLPKAVLTSNAISYVFLILFLMIIRMSPDQNPLLTAYYFDVMHKNSAAESGDVLAAMEEVEVLQQRFPNEYPSAYRQLELAGILIEHGHVEEARSIIDFVKSRESWDYNAEEVGERVAKTERKMVEKLKGTGGGAP